MTRDEHHGLWPVAGLRQLLAYLEGRRRGGQQRIWMSEEARGALKEMVRMRPGAMGNVCVKAVAPAAEAPEQPRSVEPPVREAAVVPAVMMEPPVLPAAQPPEPSGKAPVADRAEALRAVRDRAEAGERARALGTLRDTMVFAVGNPESPIMLVGEAPGAEEEKRREPFVGPAGQLLDRILGAMGLDRSKVYISNVCKFRPKVEGGDQGTRNRAPTEDEMAACLEYLREEIAIVAPRVIVGLGAKACEGLLMRKVAITQLRGQWQEFDGIPVMPTFHPSYLLRCAQDGPERERASKRQVWEDMLAVMERLDMPITEKQRAYFSKPSGR